MLQRLRFKNVLRIFKRPHDGIEAREDYLRWGFWEICKGWKFFNKFTIILTKFWLCKNLIQFFTTQKFLWSRGLYVNSITKSHNFNFLSSILTLIDFWCFIYFKEVYLSNQKSFNFTPKSVTKFKNDPSHG